MGHYLDTSHDVRGSVFLTKPGTFRHDLDGLAMRMHLSDLLLQAAQLVMGLGRRRALIYQLIALRPFFPLAPGQ